MTALTTHGHEPDALSQAAESAGAALACPFACADEFEAAVVRAQRARGAYRPRPGERFAFVAGAAMLSVLILLAALLA